MLQTLENLATRWISRSAVPDAEALAAASNLTPAVVVTGGSSGIGFALANEFAHHAKSIVLVARSQTRLEGAAQQLRKAHPGVRIETLLLDVGGPDAVGALSAWLAEHGLYCDILVNNAGIGQSGPFPACAPAELDALLATNIAGAARLMRGMLPAMLARGHGGLLSVSSLGALVPGPHQAAYYASKAFLLSLTEAIASEISGRGVRVAVVLPGPVETRFHARMNAEGSLYRHVLAAAKPERIAALTVRSYRLGRRLIAPGLIPTLTVPVLRILPHAVTVPIINWLLDTGRSPLTHRPDVSPPGN
jgi:uncharacterized protein